ncbi:MAG: tetratricopeptide repeat protein, partial [Elainellaceae cyanobacterium]
QALGIFNALQSPDDTVLTISRATVLSNLGMAHTNLKQFGDAAQCYQAALAALESLDAHIDPAAVQNLNLQERKGQVLHNMGFNLSRQSRSQPGVSPAEGLLREAVQHYERALPLRKTAENQAETLNSLAFAYGLLLKVTGDRKYFNKAHNALKSAIRRYQSSSTSNLDGLASAYDSLGHVLTIASQQDQTLLTEAEAAYEKSFQNIRQILVSLDINKREDYVRSIEATFTFSDFSAVTQQLPAAVREKLGLNQTDLIQRLDVMKLSGTTSAVSPLEMLSRIPGIIQRVDDIV